MKKYSDPPAFRSNEIRAIRKEKGLSQGDLAAYLGVTKKAVEAWEYGLRKPSGAACRLLSLLQTDDAPLFDKPEGHYLVGRKLYDPKTQITGTWDNNEQGLCVRFEYNGIQMSADCGQLINKESEYIWHTYFGRMGIWNEIQKYNTNKTLIALLNEE